MQEKEKKNKKKFQHRDVSRRSAHLGQSGRLMLLYIACHSASPPSPIGYWSLYQFLPCLPLSLLPQDCVCSGGQWHSSEWAPVIPPFCTHGCRLCHWLKVRRGPQPQEVEAETQVHSEWDRAGSWGTNTGGKKTNDEKCDCKQVRSIKA